MNTSEIDALIAVNHSLRDAAEKAELLTLVAKLEQEYDRLLDDWSMAYLMQRFAIGGTPDG